jgi:hypothetical protein
MQKDYVPYGSDISSGTYACVDCGRKYSGTSKTSMPPCTDFTEQTHPLKGWKVLTGQGDAPQDPYPDQPQQAPASKK